MDASPLAVIRSRLQNYIADLKGTIQYLQSRLEWAPPTSPPGEIRLVNNWIGVLKERLADSCEYLRDLESEIRQRAA